MTLFPPWEVTERVRSVPRHKADAGSSDLHEHDQAPLQLTLVPLSPRSPETDHGRCCVQSLVWEFHEVFGLPRAGAPTADIPSGLVQLRQRLLEEEVGEVCEALEAGNLIEIADGLADLVYVAYGTAITFGIDLDEVIAEVHRANMSKLGPGGRPRMREDGKVLKGLCYSPPDVESLLQRQARASSDRERHDFLGECSSCREG